jgi:hypothetical protein
MRSKRDKAGPSLDERRRLRAVFNAVNPAAILVVVGLNILLNTIAALLHDWIPKVPLLVAAVLGVAYLVVLIQRARRAATEEVTVSATEVHVPKCRALILFLSYRRGKTPVTDWLADPRFRGGILNSEIPKIMDLDPRTRESWRMPVEGMAIHYPNIERVIVFTSSDYVTDPVKKAIDEGSYRQYPEFKLLVEKLFEGTGREVKVADLCKLLEGRKEFENGVDFEDARTLVDALVAVYRKLHEEKYQNKEIMVDVTGGPKVTTVAGAAVVLGKDQVFQYISTRDHTPRAFDVTYIGA